MARDGLSGVGAGVVHGNASFSRFPFRASCMMVVFGEFVASRDYFLRPVHLRGYAED